MTFNPHEFQARALKVDLIVGYIFDNLVSDPKTANYHDAAMQLLCWPQEARDYLCRLAGTKSAPSNTTWREVCRTVALGKAL